MLSRSVLSLCSLLLVACEPEASPGSEGTGGASDHAQRGPRDGGFDSGSEPGASASDASHAAADARTESGDAATAPDAATTPDAANVACTDDSREPDNNATEAERHNPIHGIVPVELEGMVACPGDRDVVWAGWVDAGGKAGAVLTWDESLGDLVLSLGDADDMPITQADVSTSHAGRAEQRVDEYYDSYFYVRVENRSKVNIPYTLTITAQVFGP